MLGIIIVLNIVRRMKEEFRFLILSLVPKTNSSFSYFAACSFGVVNHVGMHLSLPFSRCVEKIMERASSGSCKYNADHTRRH